MAITEFRVVTVNARLPCTRDGWTGRSNDEWVADSADPEWWYRVGSRHVCQWLHVAVQRHAEARREPGARLAARGPVRRRRGRCRRPAAGAATVGGEVARDRCMGRSAAGRGGRF